MNKPQREMSRSSRTSSRFEVRFGMVQMAVILAVVCASLFCAYIFGYTSGKKNGFDLARSAAAAHLPGVSIQADSYTDADEAFYEKEAESLAFLVKKLEGTQPEEGVINEGKGITGAIDDEKKSSSQPEEIVESERARLNNKVTVEEALLSDYQPPVEKSAEKEKVTASEVAVEKALLQEEESEKVKLALRRQEDALRQKELEKKERELERKKEIQEQLAREEAEKIKQAKLVEESIAPRLPTSEVNQDSMVSAEADLPARPRSQVKQGYYAQVATVNDLQDARELATRLQASGFRAEIESARVRGISYYRVLVGSESNRQRANILLDQLKRESYLRTQPFIKYMNGK